MALFVCYLLGRLGAYGHQTWQGGSEGARKTPRENEIWKFQSVAMEIRKFSHGSDIGLIALNLVWYNLIPHSNFPAKNERNLPSGSRDRPIATGMATRFRLRLSWTLGRPRARAWRPRARDVARDVTDVKQIGIEVLSMSNFEFLKSDHY